MGLNQQAKTSQNIAKSPHDRSLNETQQLKHARSQGSLASWIILSTSIAGIPLINLMLFFFQDSGLISTTGLSKTRITGLGAIQDYKLFYVAMGMYFYIIFTLIVIACHFANLKHILKMTFLVDHVMMVMLAADVTYIGLHLLTFSNVYDSNQETYILQPHIHLCWQDVIVMILYFLTNLMAVGAIRVTITSVNWKAWQVVALKLMVVATSLLYFVLGLVYLFGKAPMDIAIQHFIKEYSTYIIDLFGQPSSPLFGQIPLFQNYNSSLREQAILVDNFTVVYLIANFTFFFEIIHKISEFDGTAELRTHYTFVQPEEEK